MTSISFSSIHEALLGRGFRQEDSIRQIRYRGLLEVGPESVPVYLELPDYNLQKLPIVQLQERPKWIPETCNHIGSDDSVCYAMNGHAFIDRHQAAQQILFCLDCAAETLNKIRLGSVLDDVDQEFLRYWDGEPILVDATVENSQRMLNVVKLNLPDRDIKLLIDNQQDALEKYRPYLPSKTELHSAILIPASRTPPAIRENWPPKTLKEFLDWIYSTSRELKRPLRTALRRLNGLGVQRALFIVHSNPAGFGFSFALPPLIRKFRNPERFVITLEKRSSNVKIDRFMPINIDSESILQRNQRDNEKSLTGLRVVLAGCGAIGGHLAQAIARIGAGFGRGTLFLVDPDSHKAGNIGRHRIGFEGLFRPKSEGLADSLKISLPGIDVRPLVSSVLDLDLQEYDLVIDATGEEQLSEELNSRFLAGKSAPIIFSWIIGNGLAVQSFTLYSKKQGCLHCWKSPDHVAAFVPAKQEESEIRVGRGCNDPYAPFNGASPLLASGLALQAIIDWASEKPNPTLRTIQIDYKSTRNIKPKSPKKNDRCPACGTGCRI